MRGGKFTFGSDPSIRSALWDLRWDLKKSETRERLENGGEFRGAYRWWDCPAPIEDADS